MQGKYLWQIKKKHLYLILLDSFQLINVKLKMKFLFQITFNRIVKIPLEENHFMQWKADLFAQRVLELMKMSKAKQTNKQKMIFITPTCWMSDLIFANHITLDDLIMMDDECPSTFPFQFLFQVTHFRIFAL